MASGILLQPEFVIAQVRQDPDDPLLATLNDFLTETDTDYYPCLSAMSYGLVQAALLSSAKLTDNERQELRQRLRTLRRGLDKDGAFFVLDAEAADEYAVVRNRCRDDKIALDAERQVEYGIALAKCPAILAPSTQQQVYLKYPSLIIEYR